MIAFNNLSGIAALSIVLVSTLGSAAPAPGQERTVKILNANDINLARESVVARAEADKNVEDGLPIIGDLLGSLPLVGDLLGSLPIVGQLLVTPPGERKAAGGGGDLLGGLLGGLLGRDENLEYVKF